MHFKETIKRFIPRSLLAKLQRWHFMHYFRNTATDEGIELRFQKGKIEAIKHKSKMIILAQNHLIYMYDIVRLFDYYFDAVVPKKENIQGKDYLVVDYSNPAEHTLNGTALSFFFPSMAQGLQTAKSYLVDYTPKEGDVVLDCGAYCGITTYLFSKAVGETGRVYALEPDALSYKMLLKNIDKHGLTNVIPVKKGIWSTTTKLDFNAEGNLGGSVSSILERDFYKKVSEIEVISLSDFYREYGLSRLDFIKMDIEGAEIDVLKGAKDFIREHNLNFAIASYHVVDGKESYIELENIFSELGYDFETYKIFEGQNFGNLVTYARKN
jgi:FkbM family methyltransferase